MSVQWISDFTGPLPPDTGIDFWVYPLASETIVGHWGALTDSNSGQLPLSLDNSVQLAYGAALQEGAEITVKTRLASPLGTIDEGTTTGLHWNSSSQLTQLLLEVTGGASTGGFTDTDRFTLQATQQQTMAQFGTDVSTTTAGVGELLSHPPLGFMKLQVLPIIGSGDGTIPGDSNLLPVIYGLWWEIVGEPPGAGYVIGPTRHFFERVVQLRAIYTVNGVDLVGELVDADYDRVIWLWREPKPTRIEFSVTPGWQLQFALLVYINL
jgi:hypothetical protein